MKRKLLCILLIVAVLVTIIWPMVPLATSEARFQALPLEGKNFRAKRIQLDPSDLKFLGQAKAVQQLVAVSGGGRVILTVIDGTKDRHVVHDPSYCMAGGGWKIQDKEDIFMANGNATFAKMTKGKEETQAIWFFDDGTRQFSSPLKYWIRTSLRRLTLGLSSPEPVLVMFRAYPGEPVDWERVRHLVFPEMGF